MNIVHTAGHEIGQIYIPFVNWTLAAATLAAVIGFGSSDALTGAYGIAVSLLMAITPRWCVLRAEGMGPALPIGEGYLAFRGGPMGPAPSKPSRLLAFHDSGEPLVKRDDEAQNRRREDAR
jgi:hypothetical protein